MATTTGRKRKPIAVRKQRKAVPLKVCSIQETFVAKAEPLDADMALRMMLTGRCRLSIGVSKNESEYVLDHREREERCKEKVAA